MRLIFFQMISNLRQHESVLLAGKMKPISIEEENEVAEFLAKEYQTESLEYPFISPEFNVDAALWAAKTIYIASNLMLYREQKETEIEELLQVYPKEINASAILSADLTLRFLPLIITNLKLIDLDDKLIKLLENQLQQWHYSAIEFNLDYEVIDFQSVKKNKCLHQLYCNRIMHFKNITLAKHPAFNDTINANMGLFANVFWKELNTSTT